MRHSAARYTSAWLSGGDAMGARRRLTLRAGQVRVASGNWRAEAASLSRAVRPGEHVDVPLYASFLSGRSAFGDSLILRAELRGWSTLGEERRYATMVRRVPYRPWMSQVLAPLPLTMPNEPAVVVLTVRLEDAAGRVLHRNFTAFVVAGEGPTTAQGGDYMRGGGFHDPSRNPNSYPMTGTTPFPSAVTVSVNGHRAGRWTLADDPADSRGILSWHAQPHDRHLYEAGSYGQLLRVRVPAEALSDGARSGALVVRLSVDEALPGGLAIYGAQFGRYPLDPTVLFLLR